MTPVRLDLTTRLARRSGCSTTSTRWSTRGGRRRRCWRRSTTARYVAAVHARVRGPPAPTSPGPGHRRRPGLRRDARGVGPRRPGHARLCRGGVGGRRRARRQLLRRPAPRDAHPRVAASASTTTPPSASSGCSTTAPSASPTSTSTCTTATASSGCSGTTRGCSPSRCTRAAGTCSPAPAGRRTSAGPPRGARPPTSRSRPGTGDAGWLRALDASCRRGARLRPGRPGDPARLRHPPARPAGAPGHHRRRAAPRPRALHDLAHEVGTAGGSRSAEAATSSSRSCRGRGRT